MIQLLQTVCSYVHATVGKLQAMCSTTNVLRVMILCGKPPHAHRNTGYYVDKVGTVAYTVQNENLHDLNQVPRS
jgi:hypothetical protein